MRKGRGPAGGLLPLLLAAALGIGALAGVGSWAVVANSESAGGPQPLARLEEALRRGAVSCYARDGVYPPTLEDLLRCSGVLLDETRYAVDYQIFAENLMPEITVLERGDLG